ncbi:Putative chlorite dismutase [Mycobacteroides abscessus]|nr:Putative chlorite dismutase [Mycobacteroides abscessus]
MASLDFDTLNSTIRYLMFSVFQVRDGGLGDDRDGVADEVATLIKRHEDDGVGCAASTTWPVCAPMRTS